MATVALLALFWSEVAAVVHALLVGAVSLAVLVPASVLVARIIAMVREHLTVRATTSTEQAAADYAHRAAHPPATATLRESA